MVKSINLLGESIVYVEIAWSSCNAHSFFVILLRLELERGR